MWDANQDSFSVLGARAPGARENRVEALPEHLESPAVHPGSHKNVVLSLTVPDSSTYTFGRDVNLLWKHGILAEKLPSGKVGGSIDVEEGSHPLHSVPPEGDVDPSCCHCQAGQNHYSPMPSIHRSPAMPNCGGSVQLSSVADD